MNIGCTVPQYPENALFLVRPGLVDPMLLVVHSVYPPNTYLSELRSRCQMAADRLTRRFGTQYFCITTEELKLSKSTIN
jgi:hypothetical protein